MWRVRWWKIPEYSYKCRKCNAVFRDLNTISKRHTTDCECGGKAVQDMDADLAYARGRSRDIPNEKERWSRSMGVPVKQLAEFRKKYPHHVYDDKGRLLIKGRKHKLKTAKERGFVELDDNTSKAWFR